jgi:hypothetical protein
MGGFAADETHLYFILAGSSATGPIWRIPLTGGAPDGGSERPVHSGAYLSGGAIAVNQTCLFWSDSASNAVDAAGSIYAGPK